NPDVIADVAERVTPSVVNISATTVVQGAVSPLEAMMQGYPPGQPRFGKSLGSGVIVSTDGLIVTNHHVVAHAARGRDILVSTADGVEYAAELVGADPKSDLALLRLRRAPKGLRPLRLGDSAKLRLGEVVLAIGNPFGIGQSVSMGIVSATGRANLTGAGYGEFIQTDAAINPGNSGGALVNLRGELVGINTAIFTRSGGYQGIGFAIPTELVAPVMKMLLD